MLIAEWGLPRRALVLEWATPAGAAVQPPTERDLPGLAVIAGTPGVAGPAGAAFVHSFAFGDATPDELTTITAGRTISSVRIAIDEVFDGVAATISVGSLAVSELLFPRENVNPAEIGIYETSLELALTASLAVNLFITPGAGATTGRGRVLIFA